MEKDVKNKGFGTKCVHAGYKPDKNAGAHTVPIYQNSTYVFENAEQGALRFGGKEKGFKYTRLYPCSPTHKAFTDKLAVLENTEKGMAYGSGMAAISAVSFSLLEKGDHILSGNTLYGCTVDFFDQILRKKYGIQVSFVDSTEPEEIEKALTDKTKMVFLETPANPTMNVSDIKEISKIAHEKQAKVVVDNTFASSYFQKPIDLGADVVMHSCTKYIGGHGDLVGGVLAGSQEFIESTNSVNHSVGSTMGAHEAYLCVRGLKTLHLRMEKHQENAFAVAKFLEDHKAVEWVKYPGLESHPQHLIAKKQMTGFSGMIAFGLKGGLNTGKTLMNSVKLMSLAVSLGSVDTLIQHPASMTHAIIPREARQKAGITDDLVRISVGIENKEDIIEDLNQAISKSC